MSDQDRMRAIDANLDRVGRETVFNYLRASGWQNGSMPPLWVWEQAVKRVDEIRTLHERVLHNFPEKLHNSNEVRTENES